LNRRDFLKVAGVCASTPLFARSNDRLYIKLPKKPFEYYEKKSRQKGARVLIIGGIHGNEIGAYKAANMLVDTTLKRGEMLIIPRSNFTSILADVRGYNGDMNRKFESISKKDPDYYYVELLKEAILNYKPDVVISMHDGYGFAARNPNAWGQSVVIDEIKYKNFDLYKEANIVKTNANKQLRHTLAIINTKTFTGVRHKEQKKALTGWCLKNDIKAFCIEASKQLPTLEEKIKTHLVMLKEFFKIYGIEIEGGMDYLIENIKTLNRLKNPRVELSINDKKIIITSSKTLRVPKKSIIEVRNVYSQRGDFMVPHGVNLNWSSFHFNALSFNVKNDYKTMYKIHIRKV